MNRRIALRFSKEYFEGMRKQGYGGHRNAVRWPPIAENFVLHFDLKAAVLVLDGLGQECLSGPGGMRVDRERMVSRCCERRRVVWSGIRSPLSSRALPARIAAGAGGLSDVDNLNLLGAPSFLSLFPADRDNRLLASGLALLSPNPVCVSRAAGG